MNAPGAKPSLEQLADGAAQGVRDLHSKAAEQAAQQGAPRRGRLVLALSLAVVCAGMLAVQAPRFAAPHEWPDPARSPVVADADLETLVGLIDAYRLDKGRYPTRMAEIQLPPGLAEVVAGSSLAYRPSDTSYVLDWTLPHWQATYSSESGQASVLPRGKP